jgi:hypothetical protein
MMETASTSETLVNFYETTRRYNPEDSHLCKVCIFMFLLISLVTQGFLGYFVGMPNIQAMQLSEQIIEVQASKHMVT